MIKSPDSFPKEIYEPSKLPSAGQEAALLSYILGVLRSKKQEFRKL